MTNGKVYTLTCTWAESYGAVLQAFALAKSIGDLGWDTQILNYQPSYDAMSLARRVLTPVYRPKYMRFLRESGLMTESVYRDIGDLRAGDLAAEAFVVGSDQVWNCTKYFNGNDDAMFLDFAPRGSKRIAYAASLAMSAVPSESVSRYRRLLDKFDAISVRESTGTTALEEIGIDGVSAMIDPVYLLNQSEWAGLADRASKDHTQTEYVLVVCLEQRGAVYEYARGKADALGVKLYSLTNGPRGFQKPALADKNFRDVPVYDYLSLVQNAAAVVTDSFHAMSFSLIFNRDVRVVPREDGGNSRMLDLLEDLSVKDLVTKAPPTYGALVNYASVNPLIGARVDAAKAYLRTALAGAA